MDSAKAKRQSLHQVLKAKFSFGAPKSVRLKKMFLKTTLALKTTLVVLCGLAKVIACHSLIGLNIIIFHDNQ